ncbi:M16 family metallopeptidase [Jatrophihabitans fulvus]
MTVPALTKPKAARALKASETTLDNGLRVVAVRKPGVPLVEMRLRLPFLSAKPEHPARATVLAEVLPTGAGPYDRSALAAAVQELGADLSVSVDADRLIVGGNVLATNLRPLLDIVATVLTEPAYAKDEVATERDRMVERLTIARARAGVVAAEALARRMYGDHPYAVDLPQPEAVAEVTSANLRSLHKSLVRPDGAMLVLVGEATPDRMIAQAQEALAGWTGTPTKQRAPKLPTPPGGPLLVVDRPGSVQSSLRMGRAGIGRLDERFPALALANMIFGGYFSSRWTENIREDKGYTYGPHSRIEHHALGSSLTLEAEVATEVTAPALLETWYELGRIASLPVTATEVDSVRQYAIGTLALSTATQAGLASTLSALSPFGLGLDWIKQYPSLLQKTTVEDVSAAAAEFFTPTGFTSVVVGDAGQIAEPLARLGAVER